MSQWFAVKSQGSNEPFFSCLLTLGSASNRSSTRSILSVSSGMEGDSEVSSRLHALTGLSMALFLYGKNKVFRDSRVFS